MTEKTQTLDDLKRERVAFQEKQMAAKITGTPQHADVAGEKYVITDSSGSGATVRPAKQGPTVESTPHAKPTSEK